MTDQHDPEHERVLAAILCGDRATPPPEVETCPVCSERLARLRTTAAAVTAAGAEQRAVLAKVQATPPVIGDERVAALVREGLGMQGSRRRTPWPWWMLAAAMLAGVLWLARGSALPADRTLGTNGYWPTGNIGALDDPFPFRWPAEPGSRYWLVLYEPDEDLQPWDSFPCTHPLWQPTEDEVARMRAQRDDWSWEVETVHEPPGGAPPVKRRSERQYFSFSR